MCPGCGNGRGKKASGQLAVIILPHFLPHTSNSLSNTHTHTHNAHKHSNTSPFPTGPARVLTQPSSFAKISTKKQAFFFLQDTKGVVLSLVAFPFHLRVITYLIQFYMIDCTSASN